MEDLSKSARDRFMERLVERENFITIPERGSEVLFFTHLLGSPTGIEVTTSINDLTRTKYKSSDNRPRKRKIKTKIIRTDIGKMDGVVNRRLIRYVAEGYVPTIESTLQFVNLYLNINLDVEDIVTQFFNPKGSILLIRVKRTSLLYYGELEVQLV